MNSRIRFTQVILFKVHIGISGNVQNIQIISSQTEFVEHQV